MAALRAELETHGLGDEARSDLRRWYWCNVFMERYSSAVESKSRKDYAAGEEHEATRTIHGVTCGYERWPVKTLTDPEARRIDFAVRPATVRYLGSLPASPGGRDSRGPLESRVFGVQARVVGVRREADSDYHLILSEGGATMIAEMPLTGCTSGAQHRYAMTAARAELERAVGGPVGESWIHPGLGVRIAGVLFFDLPHGQSGHARNYAELHPVTGFRVLTASQ